MIASGSLNAISQDEIRRLTTMSGRANLPDPDVLAIQIEDLQATLEQFGEITEDME